MTPDELEARFKALEERLAAVEEQLSAADSVIDVLIGSHPDPAGFAEYVQLCIRAIGEQTATGRQKAAYDRLTARLKKVEQTAQAKLEKRFQNLVHQRRDREEREAAAAAELQRQRDDLGRDIGRGGAGGSER